MRRRVVPQPASSPVPEQPAHAAAPVSTSVAVPEMAAHDADATVRRSGHSILVQESAEEELRRHHPG